MGFLQSVVDGWANVYTGLGLDRDKRQGGGIKQAIGQQNETFFDNLYAGDDIAAKIANLPPREMIREWIDFSAQSTETEPTEGEVSRVETPEQNKDAEDLIMKKLIDLKAPKRLVESMTWARSHGGSLLFLGVDDGTDPEDPNGLAEPLDVSKVKSFVFLTVFVRFVAHIDQV
jgi:hypothetical protein